MRLSIIVLAVLLSILASQSSVLAAQTTVSGLLYINLSLTRISQVFFMNGSSSFQTNIAAEITYTGQDPPKWIAFSESSINPALRDLSNTPVAAFGNNTWVQVGTNTWKPAAMVSGPYQLPGRYNAFVTGDVNNWPNEKISFIFAVAVSNFTVSGQAYNQSNVSLNVDNLNAASIHYYYAKPTALASFSTSIFDTPVTGYVFRWDLSHEGTVVQGLVHVTILRYFYGPLIAILSTLVALKTGEVCLRRRIPWLLAATRKTPWLFAVATRYKASILAELIATVVVFVPLYDLAVAPYVPPWVTFFNDMMTALFSSTLLLLIVSLALIPFDNASS